MSFILLLLLISYKGLCNNDILPSTFLFEAIEHNKEFILNNIKNDERNPSCGYSVEIFDPRNKVELQSMSGLMECNFLSHPVFEEISTDIKGLYCKANSQKGLKSLMEKKDTYACVLKAGKECIGFIAVRFNFTDAAKPFLQIKRLHSFYKVTNGRFYGVGKTLLNVAAVMANASNVDTLMATASFPVQGFFEHIGWNGKIINTDYMLDDKIVRLPQFKCTFIIEKDFKGF